MEAVAKLKHIRITPMKARRVVNTIRGKQATEALAILKFAPQAASTPIYKLVASAVANAITNDNLDADELFVKACFADEGPTLKRFRPRAKGRAGRINKRTCHITIVLGTLSERRLATLQAKNAGKGVSPATAARRARVERSRQRTATSGSEPTNTSTDTVTDAAETGEEN
mgnify:CR=1 FL=1